MSSILFSGTLRISLSKAFADIAHLMFRTVLLCKLDGNSHSYRQGAEGA